MAEVANSPPTGPPARQTAPTEKDPPAPTLIELDPSLVLVSGHNGEQDVGPSSAAAAPPSAAAAAAAAAATTAATGATTEVRVTEARRSSAAARMPYDRPRSRKLNRTSSNQCYIDMAGWLEAFPHMTLEDLGPGFSADSFTNSQGLKIATYAWRQQAQQQQPVAAVVLFHSYTSYALFDFLRHQPPVSSSISNQATQQLKEEPDWVPKFPGSWVEGLYRLGMNVYAMDHQSHGRSEGWHQWRCIVSKFDYFVDDALQFLKEVVSKDPSLPADAPIILLGYSMGGNVVIQTLGRIYSGDKELALRKRVNQAVLLAPLIRIKLDWATQVMVRINRSLISCWLPNLRFSRADNSGDCPFLGWWYSRDPFTYSGRTKSRMVAALFDASRKLPRILSCFPPELKLLCLQGTHDQTVDFHSPLKLYETPVKLDLLYLCGWSHYVPKHSGADRLIGLVTAWLLKALAAKAQHLESPRQKSLVNEANGKRTEEEVGMPRLT